MSEKVAVESESKVTAKSSKKLDATVKKLRLTIAETDDNPLVEFQKEIRNRGVKGYDLGEIVSEALKEVDQEWWKEKLEKMTPLEYKLQAALENPDMREKLISILS